jgi:hypothetical protein
MDLYFNKYLCEYLFKVSFLYISSTHTKNCTVSEFGSGGLNSETLATVLQSHFTQI